MAPVVGRHVDGKISYDDAAVICQRLEKEFRASFAFDILRKYSDSQKRIDLASLTKYLEEHCLDRIQGEFSPYKFLKVCWEYYRQNDNSSVDQKNVTKIEPDQLFKLWQIFNVINQDSTESTTIPMIYVVPIFRKVANIVGIEWKDDEYFRSPRDASFWKVVDELLCGLFTDVADHFMDEIIDNIYTFYVLNIVKIGYLSKRGHIRPNIKERYFVLKHDVMEYYTENMKEKKGSITIDKNTVVESKPGDRAGNSSTRYCFAVTDSKTGKVYDIYTPYLQIKLDWMDAIRRVINARKEGKFIAQLLIENDHQVVREMLANMELKIVKPHFDQPLPSQSLENQLQKKCLQDLGHQLEATKRDLTAERRKSRDLDAVIKEYQDILDSKVRELNTLMNEQAQRKRQEEDLKRRIESMPDSSQKRQSITDLGLITRDCRRSEQLIVQKAKSDLDNLQTSLQSKLYELRHRPSAANNLQQNHRSPISPIPAPRFDANNSNGYIG